MKLTVFAALAAATVLTTALAVPADAAKAKRSYIYYRSSSMAYWYGQPRTRVTVNRRSFLDPGTETKQYDEHYTDYAFPPGYTPFIDRNDPKVSFNRMPLPDPFDIPGWRKF